MLQEGRSSQRCCWLLVALRCCPQLGALALALEEVLTHTHLGTQPKKEGDEPHTLYSLRRLHIVRHSATWVSLRHRSGGRGWLGGDRGRCRSLSGRRVLESLLFLDPSGNGGAVDTSSHHLACLGGNLGVIQRFSRGLRWREGGRWSTTNLNLRSLQR